MSELTITEFCDRHRACHGGREWAMSTSCSTMVELWQLDDMRPEWRVWIATQRGVLDDKTLRLFSCWCARQVWNLLTDERSRHAVEVAERYAEGKATKAELAAARAAARDAAGAAIDAAGAAWAATWDAGDAAWAAARAAGAARDAAVAEQSAWLLENAKPNFEVAQ
jgi:hypothetical protein